MNRKLKLVFWVTEVGSEEGLAAGGKVVEAQQMMLDLPLDELSKGPEEKTKTSEELEATGVIISKFLTAKLREWARAQKVDAS